MQEVLAPDKEGTLPAKTNAGQPLIKVEPLSLDVLSDEDEQNMQEITDSSVLARIDQIISGLAQATVSGATAIQSAKAGGEVLYRAILPAGQKLAESKEVAGAVRGFWKNGSKIGGQANFQEVVQKGGGMVAANAVNAAMSVTSVVVGQYYMSRIDGKLEKINEDLAEIIDFLNNEYRGRLDSLLNHIRALTTFEAEILENEEQRDSKIAQLNDLEMECTQMLSQADRTLENFTKRTDWDFDEYVDEVKKIHRWFNYQKALYIMLCQLANLKFALFKGTMSREQQILEDRRQTRGQNYAAVRGANSARDARYHRPVRTGCTDCRTGWKTLLPACSKRVSPQTFDFSKPDTTCQGKNAVSRIVSWFYSFDSSIIMIAALIEGSRSGFGQPGYRRFISLPL